MDIYNETRPEQPPNTPKTRAANSDYPGKNLKFLLALFDALGHTPGSYGRLTENPNSQSTVLRLQLKEDDMKISRARKIVDTLGYQLEIFFEEKHKPEIENDSSYIVKLPADIRKAKGESKTPNLQFVADFMKSRKISKRKLAHDIKVSPGAVFTWFTSDDMAVSYLNRIKDTYDVNLQFVITKKND